MKLFFVFMQEKFFVVMLGLILKLYLNGRLEQSTCYEEFLLQKESLEKSLYFFFNTHLLA